MENIQQRILKGIDILKDNYLLFFVICLVSSILSVYVIPFLINGSITEQDINSQLNQVGMTYGGALTFSASEITASIISFFQLSIISTILVIIAYIVKYKIDKKIFRTKKWRDWKFFLYISGISLIIVDIFQKMTVSNGNNLILSLLLTFLSAFIIIIISSILLPEELPEIKI
jgi:membrane protease YdiL (CAAX protease family)